MHYIKSDQFLSNILLVQDKRDNNISNVKVDWAEHFVDVFVFPVVVRLNDHLSSHLHLQLLQNYLIFLEVIEEDSVIKSFGQVVCA